MARGPAETLLIMRLRAVLGKTLTQSDIDFLHVLAHDDVRDYTLNYLAETETRA